MRHATTTETNDASVAATYRALEGKLAEAQALLDSLGDWEPVSLPLILMTRDGIRMVIEDHWDAETCPATEIAGDRVLLNAAMVRWAYTADVREIEQP